MYEERPERVIDRHKIDKPCLRLKGTNIRERREILLLVYPPPLTQT